MPDDRGRPATIDPTGNRTGDFVPDDPSRTGAYAPPTGQADVSSVTAGYTPSDMPRRTAGGAPAVRGYEILGPDRPPDGFPIRPTPAAA